MLVIIGRPAYAAKDANGESLLSHHFEVRVCLNHCCGLARAVEGYLYGVGVSLSAMDGKAEPEGESARPP